SVPPPRDPGDISARSEQIRMIVQDVLRRRSAGEEVPDEQVVAAHADLGPELAEQLSVLNLIGEARQLAQERGSPAASLVPDLAPLPPAGVFPGYELLRELSRGGQGVVYQAIQRSTKRKVAIKVLLEGAYASVAARRRFEREIELVAALKHPGIISIF